MKSLRIVAIVVIVVILGLAISLATPAYAQAPTFEKNISLAWTEPRAYARIVVTSQGWAVKEYRCLAQLWGKESAWNYTADNPHSTAYGIAQMLGEKSKSPVTQIQHGIRYIKKRYGNPCAAWKFWQKRYWY